MYCVVLENYINNLIYSLYVTIIITLGAQWLSGRVLDSRPKAVGSSLIGVTALWSLSKTHLS